MFTEEQQAKINEMINKEKDKWVTEELTPKLSEYKATIKELEKYKPKTLTEEEKKLQEKELELFNKEKELLLREHGLSEFGELFNVESIEELETKIAKFKEVMAEKKIDNSFIPADKKNVTDKYSEFEKSKNVTGMISSKLSSLFNK